jgi:hypothetical protein
MKFFLINCLKFENSLITWIIAAYYRDAFKNILKHGTFEASSSKGRGVQVAVFLLVASSFLVSGLYLHLDKNKLPFFPLLFAISYTSTLIIISTSLSMFLGLALMCCCILPQYSAGLTPVRNPTQAQRAKLGQ